MSRYESRPRYGPREGKAFKFCLPCRQNLAERQWCRVHGVRWERRQLCADCASGQYKRRKALHGEAMRRYDREYKRRIRG